MNKSALLKKIKALSERLAEAIEKNAKLLRENRDLRAELDALKTSSLGMMAGLRRVA